MSFQLFLHCFSYFYTYRDEHVCEDTSFPKRSTKITKDNGDVHVGNDSSFPNRSRQMSKNVPDHRLRQNHRIQENRYLLHFSTIRMINNTPFYTYQTTA